jgi:hypothetical protein
MFLQNVGKLLPDYTVQSEVVLFSLLFIYEFRTRMLVILYPPVACAWVGHR